jgi:C4-dicarboxylate-binding protein DctP
MNKNRVLLLVIAVSVAFVFSSILPINQAMAEKVYQLVEAHTGTKENTTYWAAEEFKNRVEKYSKGRIKVDIHPAGSMGSDKKLLEMCQQGSIDIAHSSQGNYAHIGKAFLPFDLPYIVYGHYNWFRVMTNSEIVEEMEKRVEKDGLKWLQAFPAGGERHIMNSDRIVRSPDEANGMKLRVVASPINQNLIKAWGFNPVSIAWSETYQSVQQGIVKGVYLPNMWAYISKIYEVATKITETGGIGIWHVVVMNPNTYKNLPKELQDAVDRAATEARIACYEHDQYWSRVAIEKMKASGCEFYKPSLEEQRKWIEKAKATWDPMIEKLNLDKNFIKKIQDVQIPFDKY